MKKYEHFKDDGTDHFFVKWCQISFDLDHYAINIQLKYIPSC